MVISDVIAKKEKKQKLLIKNLFSLIYSPKNKMNIFRANVMQKLIVFVAQIILYSNK